MASVSNVMLNNTFHGPLINLLLNNTSCAPLMLKFLLNNTLYGPLGPYAQIYVEYHITWTSYVQFC